MTLLEKITLIGLLGPLSVGRAKAAHAASPAPADSAPKGSLAAFTGERAALAHGFRESQGSAGSTVGTARAKAIVNT